MPPPAYNIIPTMCNANSRFLESGNYMFFQPAMMERQQMKYRTEQRSSNLPMNPYFLRSTMSKKLDENGVRIRKSWIKHKIRGREVFVSAKKSLKDNSLLLRVVDRVSGIAWMRNFRAIDLFRIMQRAHREKVRLVTTKYCPPKIEVLIGLVLRAVYDDAPGRVSASIDICGAQQNNQSVFLVVSPLEDRSLRYCFRLWSVGVTNQRLKYVASSRPNEDVENRIKQIEAILYELKDDVEYLKRELLHSRECRVTKIDSNDGGKRFVGFYGGRNSNEESDDNNDTFIHNDSSLLDRSKSDDYQLPLMRKEDINDSNNFRDAGVGPSAKNNDNETIKLVWRNEDFYPRKE